MKLFRRLVKPSARKFVGRNIVWLAAIGSLALLHMPVAAANPNATEANAEHWVDRQLGKGNYHLSQSERDGLYSCSVRGGKVLEVEFERGFVTIIFQSAAPRFFKKSELSPALLAKLKSVQANESLDLLCMHSFYRDDWQARYDEDRTVNHKLLDIVRPGHN